MDLKAGAMQYIDLFRRYGWTVDILGHNDFIAYNDTFFVAFSVCGRFVSAVSYLLCDKDEFVKAWKNKTTNTYQSIGSFAFHDYMLGRAQCKFYQHGAIANHDHDMFEIAQWLKKLRDNKKDKKKGE